MVVMKGKIVEKITGLSVLNNLAWSEKWTRPMMFRYELRKT
jgi:hypothetical protein